MHGIDFSYQGVLGIWEGLEPSSSQDVESLVESLDLAGPSESSSVTTVEGPSPSLDVTASLLPRLSGRGHSHADAFHGNYTAALNALNSRIEPDRSLWKSSVHTSRAAQRKLAMALCDWKAGEEEFAR